MTATAPTSVSTHILDTGAGRPAAGVAVTLSARAGRADWTALGDACTDADGRCTDLPALPEGTTHARLDFATGAYRSGPPEPAAGPDAGAADPDTAFFPEVTVTFAVVPGEHYHVPLLLNRYGYTVYRGS